MSTLHFEFPVWVQYRQNEYRIRPLFFQGTIATHERYEKALKSLTQTIRRQFANFKLNRQSLEEILPYRFNPDFHFEHLPMEFSFGTWYFQGRITTVWYTQGRYTLVCLPSFDYFTFIPKAENPRLPQILEEAQTHTQKLLRKLRREEEDNFDLAHYQADEKDFFTTLDFPQSISDEKIQLKEEGHDFFRQFFRPDTEFEGSQEIRRVGYELNDRFPYELSRAYYQEELVGQVQRLIYNRENAPLVLLGPRRVGKSTILQEAVFRYLEANSETTFFHLDNVWELDPSRIIAGMSIIGMWQRRMEAIIRFVMHPVPKVGRQDKLYFSNVIALFRIGKSAQNDMTLSDVLKPYLQNRQLQIILEASPEEWDLASELDRGFTDLFKVIRMQEPDEKTSLRIISRIRKRLEEQSSFAIDNYALLSLISLQKRFNRNEVLLGSVAESLYQLAAKYKEEVVEEYDILEEFGERTHLNEGLTDTAVIYKPNFFVEYLSERLIGQSEAVQCLAEAIELIKAQLNNPDRPFGSFLFIGPTGVGKTQAAKVLARFLFTHEESLVRFDMNEFIDGHSVSRLVGDFYNPEGLLTTKIRFNPYCVLLFDEIEKAHPDVHNLLLQVLGEGRLTDALGRTVSFCNTIIIMTSNLGAERVGKEINLQRREDLASSTYEKAIKDFFRPEFINRIDKIVIFNKLNAEHIGKIAWLQIQELLRRHGFLRRHTILNVSEPVLQSIATKGFDPEMGGRALKRQIEKELTVLVAEQLVELHPDTPIIFNLYLQNQQLYPHLVKLVHALPREKPNFVEIPEETLTPSHFEALLQEVEQLKTLLGENLEHTTTEPSILQLKDQILDTETQLRSILYEYAFKPEADFSGAQFRVSVPNQKMLRQEKRGGKTQKAHLQELYSHLQIQEYLSEVFQSAERIVNETHALYAEMAQRVAWHRFYLAEWRKYGVEEILLEVRSCIENYGQQEVQKLRDLYQRGFGMELLESPESNIAYLRLRGAGVRTLFESEVGFHMCLYPSGSILPIEVRLFSLEGAQSPGLQIEALAQARREAPEIPPGIDLSRPGMASILRLYHYPPESAELETITDLRSGLISRVFTAKEIQAWLYANLPEGAEVILSTPSV
ncbi:MAG: hypothetical protein OHK0053_12450 [Microscillaceae bacterium]